MIPTYRSLRGKATDPIVLPMKQINLLVTVSMRMIMADMMMKDMGAVLEAVAEAVVAEMVAEMVAVEVVEVIIPMSLTQEVHNPLTRICSGIEDMKAAVIADLTRESPSLTQEWNR